MDSHRFARNAAAGVVASIAAWSSYWHMLHVALRYGERTEVAYLLPGSVDGMLIVASMVMVDDRSRRRPVRRTARVSFAAGVAASVAANVAAAHPSLPARIVAAWPAAALLMVVEMLAHRGAPDDGVDAAVVAEADRPRTAEAPAATGTATAPQAPAGTHTDPARPPRPPHNPPRPITAARLPASPPAPPQRSTPHPPSTAPGAEAALPAAATNGGAAARGRGRPSEELRRLALQQRAAEPGLSQAELARRLGVSRRWLRDVLAAGPDPTSPPPPADTRAERTGSARTGSAHPRLEPVA